MLLVVSLLGCGQITPSGSSGGGGAYSIADLCGTWQADHLGTRVFLFVADGTYTYQIDGATNENGTFSVSGSTVTFNPAGGNPYNGTLTNATTLRLTGAEFDYVKQ